MSRRPSFTMSKRLLSSNSLGRLFVSASSVEFAGEKTIPSVNAHLDNTLPQDFFHQELVDLIKALRISKWHKRQLTVDNLKVNRILGALTNSVYKLEYRDPHALSNPPLLLLRVYGKNVDDLIDRDAELKILIRLSSRHIGPKLLGIFNNGRFEQFLEGFVTMAKDDIRDPVLSQMIGRRMKKLHTLVELDARETKLEFPVAWLQLLKWLPLVEREYLPIFEKDAIENTLLMPWASFKDLVFSYREFLFAKYDTDRLADNFCFCHNDTQYGNLLLKDSFDPCTLTPSSAPGTANETDHNLAVIDFEYAGPNFAAYDIADHFSEWMADYHDVDRPYFIHIDKYPSVEEKVNFLSSYVEYNSEPTSSNLKTATVPPDEPAARVDFEVKKLFNEIIYWRATVLFFWLVWGLIQHASTKDPVADLGSKKATQGVGSMFEHLDLVITNLKPSDTPEPDDEITSTVDNFNYLKFSQQKAALVVGDMISFGLLSISDIAPQHHNKIKYLDTQVFEL